VQVTQPGSPTQNVVGQLELATFTNEAGLSAQGANLFLETPASGTPTTGTPGVNGVGTLTEGYTEASNVDPVSEITALIVAQRAYEMNSKVVTTADNMLQTANQVKS
jgi:flagellar basal-body rod protein FlgG